MLNLFSSKPPIDEDTVSWMFEIWHWALRNFEADVFFNETVLVFPSNDFFPGRADSVAGMAALIFEHVRKYAGVSHWPCRLVEAGSPLVAPKEVVIAGALRGPGGEAVSPISEDAWLMVPYNPHQVSKPEALIADYAHVLAYYLGTIGKEPPPGGDNSRPAATEILGIFMGFGLMFANSAYTYRGGCGACYNPLAERTAFLSQDEASYALAIFCHLKDIPEREALSGLKKYLRPVFKRAMRDLGRREQALHSLREERRVRAVNDVQRPEPG